MKACVRYAPMIGSRPGELSEADARGLAEHVAGCDACQARVADEEALSGLLSEALLAEAARRDFTSFAEGVLERVAGPSAARESLLARIASWVRAHRTAAAVSALAPALAALALIVYLGRAPPEQAAVEVSAEGRPAILLHTSEGPVVLFGSADGS